MEALVYEFTFATVMRKAVVNAIFIFIDMDEWDTPYWN
jgi:hypothetical protein